MKRRSLADRARAMFDSARDMVRGTAYVALTFWAYELGARAHARREVERRRAEVLRGCSPSGGHFDNCDCGRARGLDGETFVALALAFVVAGASVLSGCSASVVPVPAADGGGPVDAATGCKSGFIECPEGLTCNVVWDVCEEGPSVNCWNADAGAWEVCP